MKKILVLLIASILFLTVGCSSYSTGLKKNKDNLSFHYDDITKSSKVNFLHEKPVFDHKADKIMPWLASTGASVAVGDYNNDGNMDLYFTNSKKGSKNALFKNNGDGTFKRVDAGVTDINKNGISSTALFFDYNNDGKEDLFVGAWGKSQLFKNIGDGKFKNVTKASGINQFAYVSKAIALDYNQDGLLDLYLGCYFRSENDLWHLKTTDIMNSDFENARNGGKNLFYRNNGDGTFTEVSKKLNVDDPGWTLAMGAADLNHDGYPDIYNANDFGPDSLYINQQGKGFKKVSQPNGIGEDTHKGMNVDFADIFHEGKFGIYVSNVSQPYYIIEGNDFWYPDQNGVYQNIAEKLGIGMAGFSWGAKFFDVNNSGEFSLMVTNGFITGTSNKNYWFDLGTLVTTPGTVVKDFKNWPKIGKKSLSGNQKKALFLNKGKGKEFVDVAQQAGITFTEDGRGVGVVDLNNDGALDLVFANQGGKAKVYKNQIKNENHWITLDLKGTYPSNSDAIGAKVYITTNQNTTLIERDGGNGFGAQSDPRIHFGTKGEKDIKEIKIIWPSGRVQTLKHVKTNQILHVKEDAQLPIKKKS